MRTWQTVRDNIRRCANLPTGWDSYGGLAATPENVKKALQWATTFEAVGFPVARECCLESSGHFGFEWEVSGHVVSVSTDGEFETFFLEAVKAGD